MSNDRANALVDRCIFMTTPMRSGSTLLSRMLSAHPAVGITYDSVNFFRFCYRRYDPISNMDNVRRLFSDMAYRLYNRFEMVLDEDKCVAYMGASDLSYGQAYLSILRSLLSNTGKTMLGDKEALAWTKIPDFLQMCPNGKAIVTLRDPRDVVTSFKSYTNAPGNDYLIALFNVVDAVNHAFRLRSRYSGRIYIVEFGRLKMDTEKVLRGLCEFLDIDFVPEMMEQENYTDLVGNKWDPKDSLTFKEETSWLAPVGRWRTKIDAEDLYLCEWIGGEQICRLGLSLDGREQSQEIFDKAIEKITSSPLLREAFKRWCDLHEGTERFPTDPLNPANWDPTLVKHPGAFTTSARLPDPK